MLNTSAFTGIYLHREPVDFRKSINGLSMIVEQSMNVNVFGPHLFVFCNKRRDKLKVLYWDTTGFALWYKRLEEERFKWPRKLDDEVIQIDGYQLEWLLSGYDIWKMHAHKKLHYTQLS